MCLGSSDDRLFCGVPSLAHQWRSELPGVALKQEGTPAGWQLTEAARGADPGTAVRLWERQTGKALLPAAGLSCHRRYSCQLVYIKYVIQGLKLKLK